MKHAQRTLPRDIEHRLPPRRYPPKGLEQMLVADALAGIAPDRWLPHCNTQYLHWFVTAIAEVSRRRKRTPEAVFEAVNGEYREVTGRSMPGYPGTAA